MVGKHGWREMAVTWFSWVVTAGFIAPTVGKMGALARARIRPSCTAYHLFSTPSTEASF